MPVEKEYPKILTKKGHYFLCEFPRLFQVYWNVTRDKNMLFQACEVDNLESVKIILNSGVDVNISKVLIEDAYTTPLMTAAQHGHFDLVQFLVERGANINPNNMNRPLTKASREGYLEIFKFLAKNGAWLSYMDLIVSCENDHLEIVRYILDIFNDPNQELRALETAVKSNHLEIVEFVVNRGNLKSLGFYTDIGICIFLLERGASVSQTYLDSAQRYDRNDLIDLFKEWIASH